MKKKILWALLIIIIAAGGFAWYLWNKPPGTVDNRKGMLISATSLSDAFLKDEKAANSRYLNQVLSVTGTIEEVDTNQDKKIVILLSGSNPLSGVQCTMRKNNIRAETGKTITIKGFCHGYTTVALLSDCIVQ